METGPGVNGTIRRPPMSLVVVGGGPAGLAAAIGAAETGRTTGCVVEITVLERNAHCALKLLASGSGQCNLSHAAPVQTFLQHYGEHGWFLAPALDKLSPEETLRKFHQWGVPTIIRSDAKVFPADFKARSVSEGLVSRCSALGIAIKHNTRVVEVSTSIGTSSSTPSPGGARYFSLGLETTGAGATTMEADALVIATGGVSWPKTGSTGDGYTLAEHLGHTVEHPRAALTGIALPGKTLEGCEGVSFSSVRVSIASGQWAGTYRMGDLLITHQGLSGPAILDVSRYLNTGDTVSVCFACTSDGIPIERSRLVASFMSFAQHHGAVQTRSVLTKTGLAKSFCDWVCAHSGVDGRKRLAETGKRDLDALAGTLTDCRFTVSLKGMLQSAMVTAGGISLAEVDSTTMQSRLVPALFFAGEVLDIDGDSGGFNLQGAWSTGWTAGSSAVQLLVQ